MKVGMGTVKKLTIENMDITCGILSQEIHLGGHFLPPPLNWNAGFSNTRVNISTVMHSYFVPTAGCRKFQFRRHPLSYGFGRVILCLAVLIQYRSVTHTHTHTHAHTDRHMTTAYIAR